GIGAAAPHASRRSRRRQRAPRTPDGQARIVHAPQSAPLSYTSFERSAAARGVQLRHCPECRRLFTGRADLCPDCWQLLHPARRLSLSRVCETSLLYEADLLEAVLIAEGIPCVRVPRGMALPPGPDSLRRLRVYVRSDMAPAARDLVAAVLGRRGAGSVVPRT